MVSLSRLLKTMDKVVYSKHVFHYSSDLLSEREWVESFLKGNENALLLEEPKGYRALYLINSKPAVLKCNRLQGWKRLVRRKLGIVPAGDYCLSNEFLNLSRLNGSGLVPKVYGFGYGRRSLARDEYLLIEFLSGMRTVDEIMVKTPGAGEWVASQVVDIFCRMLDSGFIHMDPHPSNIMLGEQQGNARFIDLECCAFDNSDPHFALAFSLGYFFHFWFSRFVDEQIYDEWVLGLVAKRKGFPIDERFLRIYQRFKTARVSRKERFEALVNNKFRSRFERSIVIHGEIMRKLKETADGSMRAANQLN